MQISRTGQRSIIVSSFGKTYHTTGWKTGYVLAPKELTDEFRKVYSYLMFSAYTPVQFAYADMLDDEDHYLGLNDFYQCKRDLFLDAISGTKFKPVPARGPIFCVWIIPAYTDEHDRAFAERITKEHGVACIPTSVFYHDKLDEKILRFCFAKNDDTLLKAAEQLCRI